MLITRRKIIGYFGFALLLPLAGVWASMVSREKRRNSMMETEMELGAVPMGYSEYEDFYIWRDAGQLSVYSLKCPHLGCKVRRQEGGIMVCPCHGSAFDAESGQVSRGPAPESLKRLEFSILDDMLIIVNPSV